MLYKLYFLLLIKSILCLTNNHVNFNVDKNTIQAHEYHLDDKIQNPLFDEIIKDEKELEKDIFEMKSEDQISQKYISADQFVKSQKPPKDEGLQKFNKYIYDEDIQPANGLPDFYYNRLKKEDHNAIKSSSSFQYDDFRMNKSPQDSDKESDTQKQDYESDDEDEIKVTDDFRLMHTSYKSLLKFMYKNKLKEKQFNDDEDCNKMAADIFDKLEKQNSGDGEEDPFGWYKKKQFDLNQGIEEQIKNFDKCKKKTDDDYKKFTKKFTESYKSLFQKMQGQLSIKCLNNAVSSESLYMMLLAKLEIGQNGQMFSEKIQIQEDNQQNQFRMFFRFKEQSRDVKVEEVGQFLKEQVEKCQKDPKCKENYDKGQKAFEDVKKKVFEEAQDRLGLVNEIDMNQIYGFYAATKKQAETMVAQLQSSQTVKDLTYIFALVERKENPEKDLRTFFDAASLPKYCYLDSTNLGAAATECKSEKLEIRNENAKLDTREIYLEWQANTINLFDSWKSGACRETCYYGKEWEKLEKRKYCTIKNRYLYYQDGYPSKWQTNWMLNRQYWYTRLRSEKPEVRCKDGWKKPERKELFDWQVDVCVPDSLTTKTELKCTDIGYTQCKVFLGNFLSLGCGITTQECNKAIKAMRNVIFDKTTDFIALCAGPGAALIVKVAKTLKGFLDAFEEWQLAAQEKLSFMINTSKKKDMQDKIQLNRATNNFIEYANQYNLYKDKRQNWDDLRKEIKTKQDAINKLKDQTNFKEISEYLDFCDPNPESKQECDCASKLKNAIENENKKIDEQMKTLFPEKQQTGENQQAQQTGENQQAQQTGENQQANEKKEEFKKETDNQLVEWAKKKLFELQNPEICKEDKKKKENPKIAAMCKIVGMKMEEFLQFFDSNGGLITLLQGAKLAKDYFSSNNRGSKELTILIKGAIELVQKYDPSGILGALKAFVHETCPIEDAEPFLVKKAGLPVTESEPK